MTNFAAQSAPDSVSEFKELVTKLLKNKAATDNALAELKDLAGGVVANQPVQKFHAAVAAIEAPKPAAVVPSKPARTTLDTVCDVSLGLVIAFAVVTLSIMVISGLVSYTAIRLGHIAREAWDEKGCNYKVLDELAYGLIFTAGWSMIFGQLVIALAKETPAFLATTSNDVESAYLAITTTVAAFLSASPAYADKALAVVFCAA